MSVCPATYLPTPFPGPIPMRPNAPFHHQPSPSFPDTNNHLQLKTLLPPPPPPLPLPIPPADPPSPAASDPSARPVPSGSGLPTGGVKPTPFVYVSGAGAVVVRDVAVVGMGLGVVVAVLL